MFLAVIIPPAHENHVVAGVVAVSFAASLAASVAPLVSGLSEGVRTILLTVGIAAAAAALYPVPDEEGEMREDVPADSVDGRQPAFEPISLSSTTAVEA